MYFNAEAAVDRLFSNTPAVWIDRLLLIGPTFGTTDGAKEFAARMTSLFISVIVLPTALAADTVYFATKSLAYRVVYLFKSNEAIIQEAVKCQELAFKCFRGFLGFGAGVLWRDIVSNHYLPENKFEGFVCPTGALYRMKADIRKPKKITDVIAIVNEARTHKKDISIAGAGFSQGKHTLNKDENGIHINMSGINYVTVNPDNKTAVVGAGATWAEVQKAANTHKLAVQVSQASNVFSVGGSVSIDCHGWDHTQGTIANTIQSIKIVNNKGEVVTLLPPEEQFKLIVGGLGGFGVIVEVRLWLTDNEELVDLSKIVPIDQYVNYFRTQVQPNKNIRMHLYRLGLTPGKLLQEGIAQHYVAGFPGTATENLKDEPLRGTLLDRIMMQIARNSPFARKMWWEMEKRNLSKIKMGTRNEIMQPPIRGAFATNSISRTEWLQEYFIPGEHLAEFIKFLGTVLDENEVSLFNASVRPVIQPEGMAKRSIMSYSNIGDSFAVVLFFSQSLNEKEVEKTKAWVRKVVDKVHEMNGTFYLPYGHFATEDQFRACYPQYRKVIELKQKYDPENLFNNGFYDHYIKEKTS